MIVRHALCIYCERTITKGRANQWGLDNPHVLIGPFFCSHNTTFLDKRHVPKIGTIVDVDTETKEIKWAAESPEIPLPKGQAF